MRQQRRKTNARRRIRRAANRERRQRRFDDENDYSPTLAELEAMFATDESSGIEMLDKLSPDALTG